MEAERADLAISPFFFLLLFALLLPSCIRSFIRPCFHGGFTTFIYILQPGVMDLGRPSLSSIGQSGIRYSVFDSDNVIPIK
jgi:hypothetical protein